MFGPAGADTGDRIRALLLGHRIQIALQGSVRQTQVVDHRRLQHRYQSDLCLHGAVANGLPVRRHADGYGRRHRVVCVHGEPRECLMRVAEAAVEPGIHLVRVERIRVDAVELREDGVIVCQGVHGILVVVLVVGEPEGAIVPQRPARADAALPARERRRHGIASQARIGGEMMVAVEGECGAGEIVGAASRHDIDGARSGHSRRRAQAERRDLELLHRFLREALHRAADEAIAGRRAIHGDPRLRIVRACDEHALIVVPEGSGIGHRHDIHRRLKLRELEKAAPVERQLFYLRPAHAAAHFHVAAIDARGLGGDIDALVAFADTEREIKREVIADL